MGLPWECVDCGMLLGRSSAWHSPCGVGRTERRGIVAGMSDSPFKNLTDRPIPRNPGSGNAYIPRVDTMLFDLLQEGSLSLLLDNQERPNGEATGELHASYSYRDRTTRHAISASVRRLELTPLLIAIIHDLHTKTSGYGPPTSHIAAMLYTEGARVTVSIDGAHTEWPGGKHTAKDGTVTERQPNLPLISLDEARQVMGIVPPVPLEFVVLGGFGPQEPNDE